MGAKFFYRNIDLVYFINNKLMSNKLINQKDRVLLSFSGGQDSICFVYILNQLYCQLQLDITFFWYHHLWQTDSFYLMQQIAKLSFFFQFNSCFTIPLNYISSELLARKWRQSCSYRISFFYNYSKICLAHTFNDKVENIFLNFMRGTGLIGLAPLRWIQFISKSNITSEKHISRYNYLNYLSLKLNEPNRCIPSIQNNSDKLKNLTKEIIKKFVYVGSSYKYKSKICTCKKIQRYATMCKKQKEYLLQQHSATQLRKPLPFGSGVKVHKPLLLQGKLCTQSVALRGVRKPIGVKTLYLYRVYKALDVGLFSQQQEDNNLLPQQENSTNVLYEILCTAKEPQKDLYNMPLTLTGFAKHGVNKNFSKAWSKQLIDGCYIVRPLLSISRIELSKICYFWELPIYPDVTNQKVKFLRNRVRRQLLPTIKIFFNLNIENVFSQLATIVETEDYCLTRLMNEFTRSIDVYHTKLDIYSKIKK